MTTQKRRISRILYTKQYDTFSEGIKELTKVSPKIDNLLENPEEYTLKEVLSTIVNMISDVTPNPESRENLLWEFQISANRVNIKTDQFIGIGWVFNNTPEKTMDSVIFKVTLFGNSNIEGKALESVGYSKVEEDRKNFHNKKPYNNKKEG